MTLIVMNSSVVNLPGQRHVSNPHMSIRRHSVSPSLGSVDSSLSAQSGILSMTIGGTNAEAFYAANKRKEKGMYHNGLD